MSELSEESKVVRKRALLLSELNAVHVLLKNLLPILLSQSRGILAHRILVKVIRVRTLISLSKFCSVLSDP